MEVIQNSAHTEVRIDRVDLPYGHRAELKDILVRSDLINPTLDSCPIAEQLRKEFLSTDNLKERINLVSKHIYLVAALWTESYEPRKYIEYEIVALKTEPGTKAVFFLSGDDYQLMAIAILGMQEFDDFKSIRQKLGNIEGAYEVGGTFGRYFWRNTTWENTPVRLYSPQGELVFSGIYRYSKAFNGNMKRELFSDEGVNLDDKELSDIVLELYPQFWNTKD